jgi:hypothetical protein
MNPRVIVVTGGTNNRLQRRQDFEDLTRQADFPTEYQGRTQNWDWCFLDPTNMGGADRTSPVYQRLRAFLEHNGFKEEISEHGAIRLVRIG